MGETAREGVRDVVAGRNPFPRKGDVRPDVGLGARDEWPVYSLMIANEDFLCCRGWLILKLFNKYNNQ